MVSSKRLFRKYLALPSRGFLTFGTFVFASEALFVNLTRPLGWTTWTLFDHLGFAVLLVGFGHSALTMVLADEHRLLSIERELEIAREIQSSILTTAVPQMRGLRIAAAYQPMTAVAGDADLFDVEGGGAVRFAVCKRSLTIARRVESHSGRAVAWAVGVGRVSVGGYEATPRCLFCCGASTAAALEP
jgi:hypothetical protein